MLGIYFDEYDELSDAKRKNMEPKYGPKKLFLKKYNYDNWFENEESTDKEELTDKKDSLDLFDMLLLEGDEEVKEEKGLRILIQTNY